MAYQSQSNAVVAYKVQTALGTPATGAAGTVLRVAGGTGGQLTKAATESNEVRSDGMRARGRHGIQKTAASWNAEASIGSWEPIAEAIMRDTWSATPLIITETTGAPALASITTTANTIVAGAGSWIAAGLRVGDVFVLTNHVTPANNGRNLRITGLTASAITVAETLTLNATPDTAFTITRPGKKLIQTGTLLKRYFTIDELEVDIDQSQVMSDFVWGSMRIGMAPNGLLTFDPGGIGTGQMTAMPTGATSPSLTAPVSTVGIPLSVVDATVRINNVDAIALTSLDITLDISPMSPDVFGSGQIKYGPDVFTGQMGIGINFTALRSDLQMLQDFANETQYSIHLLAVENEAEPKDFMSIYIGNFTLGGVTKSAYSKDGGPRTQTIAVPMALVGRDIAGIANDATMIKFQSTAP
jgi:tail tube protein